MPVTAYPNCLPDAKGHCFSNGQPQKRISAMWINPQVLSAARHQQSVMLLSSSLPKVRIWGGHSTMCLPVVAMPASDWNYPLADSKGRGKSLLKKRKSHPFLVTGDILCPCRGRKLHIFTDSFCPLGSKMQRWKAERINMRR